MDECAVKIKHDQGPTPHVVRQEYEATIWRKRDLEWLRSRAHQVADQLKRQWRVPWAFDFEDCCSIRRRDDEDAATATEREPAGLLSGQSSAD